MPGRGAVYGGNRTSVVYEGDPSEIVNDGQAAVVADEQPAAGEAQEEIAGEPSAATEAQEDAGTSDLGPGQVRSGLSLQMNHRPVDHLTLPAGSSPGRKR